MARAGGIDGGGIDGDGGSALPAGLVGPSGLRAGVTVVGAHDRGGDAAVATEEVRTEFLWLHELMMQWPEGYKVPGTSRYASR